jgi:hypothetical protein
MISLNLNRRHKAVLFLVLVAAGISLVAEASAKQTSGVVLLGLAAAWLLGSLRLRVLWLLSSLIACAAGIFTAGQPVLDDWESFPSSVQDYDRSILDLRDAVARSIAAKPTKFDWSKYRVRPDDVTKDAPPTLPADFFQKEKRSSDMPEGWEVIPPPPAGFVLEEERSLQQDWFAENAPGNVQIQVQTKGKKRTEEVDPQDRVDVHMVEIPGTTHRWVRPDLGTRTSVSFPADVDEEELIGAIQNQLLQPRPKFSIGDSLIAHRFYSLIGLAFLTAGLFSLGWYVRAVHCKAMTRNILSRFWNSRRRLKTAITFGILLTGVLGLLAWFETWLMLPASVCAALVAVMQTRNWQLNSTRRVKGKKRRCLVQSLAKKPCAVQIVCLSSDSEAEQYADDLVSAAEEAGWLAEKHVLHASAQSIPPGIGVVVHDLEDRPACAEVFGQALTQLGIAHDWKSRKEVSEDQTWIEVGPFE